MPRQPRQQLADIVVGVVNTIKLDKRPSRPKVAPSPVGPSP